VAKLQEQYEKDSAIRAETMKQVNPLFGDTERKIKIFGYWVSKKIFCFVLKLEGRGEEESKTIGIGKVDSHRKYWRAETWN